MEFEWDEAKRRTTIAKHGVDLLFAAGIFDGAVLTRLDDRFAYGEPRYVSIGLIEGECYVVVHTPRAEAVRLITAWKGGRDEWAIYQESVARGADADEAGW